MELRWVATPLAEEEPEHQPVWERTRSLRAQQGVGGVLNGIGRRLASYVWEARRATLFRRSLDGDLPTATPRIPLVMRDMRLEDLERFRDAPSRLPDGRVREFEDRLSRGRIAVIVLTADEVAGYGWLTTRDEIEKWSGAEIVLHEGEGYFFDAFTFPRFRARGIHTAVHVWRLRRLRGLGCAVAYSIADLRDPGAQKAHRNVGFAAYREIAWLRLGWIRWHTERQPTTG
jgi:hypothetical protein